MNRVWSCLVGWILACYPRAWRERFGDQVRADLDDARADQATMHGFLQIKCILSMTWDLASGAVKAHMASQQKPVASLATAGGSPAHLIEGPPDPYRAAIIALRGMPPLVLIGALLIAGAALMGMWLYDTRQFFWYGIMGAMMVLCFGQILYKNFQNSIAQPPRTSTDHLARNMQFIMLVMVLVAWYWLAFDALSSQAAAAATGLPMSWRGVLTVHPASLFWMVGLCLLASCIGSFCPASAGSAPPPRIILGVLLSCVVGGGWATLQFKVAALLPTLVFGLPLAILILAQWPRSPIPDWIKKANFALAVLPLPLLLGFLLALSQDAFHSSQDIDPLLAASPAPSWHGMVVDYDRAIKRTGNGGSPEQFWQQVARIQGLRDQWQAHKPWTSVFPTKPVGISALDWCLHSSPLPPHERVGYCQQNTVAEKWLTRMPQS